MNKIVGFCIDRPWWVIAAVLIVTVFFASQIPGIKMDSRVEVMLRHDYPPVKTFIDNEESFAAYTDVIVGMLHTDIYNPSSLEKLMSVTEELKQIEGISKVSSILNVKNIEGDEDGLVVAPMVREGEVPGTPEEVRAFRDKVASWDIYKGALVTPTPRAPPCR
jgi:predicted RND superfamily exporter protein